MKRTLASCIFKRRINLNLNEHGPKRFRHEIISLFSVFEFFNDMSFGRVFKMSVKASRVIWIMLIMLAAGIQGYVETEEFISDLDKPSTYSVKYYDVLVNLFFCYLKLV